MKGNTWCDHLICTASSLGLWSSVVRKRVATNRTIILLWNAFQTSGSNLMDHTNNLDLTVEVLEVPEVHLVCSKPQERVNDDGGGDVVKVAQLLRSHPGGGSRARLGHHLERLNLHRDLVFEQVTPKITIHHLLYRCLENDVKISVQSLDLRHYISNFPRVPVLGQVTCTSFLWPSKLRETASKTRRHPWKETFIQLKRLLSSLYDIFSRKKLPSAIDRHWNLTYFKVVSCKNSLLGSLTFLCIKVKETISAPIGAARVSKPSIFVRNWGEFFASWEKLLGVELTQLSAKVGQEERQIRQVDVTDNLPQDALVVFQ